MSKLSIDKLMICGFLEDEKKVLNLLERIGVVEINDKIIEADELRYVNSTDKILEYDKNMKACDAALDILNKYDEEKVGLIESFDGAKRISVKDFEKRAVLVEETMVRANAINDYSKDILDNKAKIVKIEQEIATLRPWEKYDASLKIEGTKDTVVYVGSIKNIEGYEDLVAKITTNFDHTVNDYIDIDILSSDKDITTFRLIALRQYKDEIDNALKKLSFVRAPYTSLVPRDEIKSLESSIKDIEKENEHNVSLIKSLVKYRDDIKFTRDFMAMNATREASREKVQVSDSVFFITGFVPTKYKDYITKKLEKMGDIYVDFTTPSETDDVPVLLNNNAFADPMETVVESYSLPNEHEFDPSKIMAIFYYIFFGMMLSDAGYGLLMAIGTGIVLLKCKNMEAGMRKMIKLFFYSALSTIFWGIMFGSFFGDAIDVIGHRYLGVDPSIQILRPIWFEPIKEPMRLLVFAFVLGIIHLFTGLFIKFYLCIKDGDIKGAIYDVIFWVLFVGGGIVYLLTMPMMTNMLGVSDIVKLPPIVATISSVCAIVGAIGVLFTGGRESRNWIKRMLKGAYAVYGVSSWLSDILSYSRILALGLATGAIAQVINQMGSMLDVPVLGLIMFIVVFIFGHLLNIGINVLGSYVHTNRLQFVEFFGKFYEGGGRKFVPFKENTKYYYVEEEI